MLGEYGASTAEIRAEFIWLSPEVGEAAASPFGGDDGLGGYMPLAVATPVTPGSTSTQLTWVHGDHLGVPIAYVSATGTALSGPPATYDAPAFPGQNKTTADLYYNRYRDYDPTLGRYIQADPIGLAGGPSPYQYALSNPVRYTDPTGEIVPVLIYSMVASGVGAAAFDFGMQAASKWWRGKKITRLDCYDWKSIGVSGVYGFLVPGPLGAARKIYIRYKLLRGAPRNLNRRIYEEADQLTKKDILIQLAKGAAVPTTKKAVESYDND